MSHPLIKRVFTMVFACRHRHAPVVQGKTYCPDCGAGLVYQWVILCCTHCNQRRQGAYMLGRIVAMDSCCTACGHQAVACRVLENPA